MKARMAGVGLAAGLALGSAHAEDVIKIAFIDPLPGAAAAAYWGLGLARSATGPGAARDARRLWASHL